MQVHLEFDEVWFGGRGFIGLEIIIDNRVNENIAISLSVFLQT